MIDNESKYFAAQSPDKLAANLLDRAQEMNNLMKANGLRLKLQDMWKAYHGAYYEALGSGHKISFSGEQGELTNLAVNHFRNIAQHMIVMTTSTRPALTTRAINTDYKSVTQTSLANSILDYYLREKRLENYFKRAVEYAVVMGAGYLKMEWDSTLGETYDVIENEDGTKTELKDGDVIFTNLSPFDVVVDSTKEDDQNLDWVLVRTYKNKYDLAAKYPEHKSEIEGLQVKSDIESYRFALNHLSNKTDDVSVYEFFHKRTAALPEGRYMMFLDNQISLYDGPMPYRRLPIYKISPGQILGTPYGYSPMFDLIPLQESVNSLYSTIMTNQSTFGVQNVWIKRGADIHVEALAGGMNVIESLEQPVPLNLTNTPPEIFKFLEMLVHAMETISGVNSVARGDPQSSLKSGAALALVQSMALQFTSGLQQSYIMFQEDVGTGLIELLQDFADAPRFVAIVGKNNRTELKQFKGDDISKINRVVVDIANPLSKTHAGRVQMAENLLQYMPDKINPSQYLNVINTGNLDTMTEDTQSQIFLIKAENEKLSGGEEVYALITDKHDEHIASHRYVLDDPDLRKDRGLVERATSHIQEHLDLWQNAKPAMLAAIGLQPLPPEMPPPPPPEMGPPPSPQGEQPVPPGMVQGPVMGQGEITGPGLEGPQNLPNIPKVPANILPNPQLQEASMKNVKVGK